ncbi:hypothetical protein [Halobacterium bonnevillei]|uniref:Small CPxCG-related zinc finger protein n=1 Tax=Halobacterium bonnevillei TaxID=2692200 RepID=A0A6B0SF41_9EURY|nr:hypothetical protein [Halobacterium bonnevillei]MXR20335.1 hypothetical protein [Halobacterium bonnevillei]
MTDDRPECDRCGLADASVRELLVRNPDGKVNVCDDCEDELNAEVVREVGRPEVVLDE